MLNDLFSGRNETTRYKLEKSREKIILPKRLGFRESDELVFDKYVKYEYSIFSLRQDSTISLYHAFPKSYTRSIVTLENNLWSQSSW